MPQNFEPAGWAVSRFGRETAAELAQRLPRAVQTAVGRQMDAQQASRVLTQHAFGGAWPARYEEFVAHLQDLPGAQVVKPDGRSFQVVLVNNIVLLPFEYAKDETTSVKHPSAIAKLNKLTQELLKLYGPAPEFHQMTIDDMFAEDDFAVDVVDAVGREPLPGFTPDGVVIVYYAVDPHLGVLKIGWGEAELVEGRTTTWTPRMQTLPKPIATPIADSSVRPATVVSAANDQHPTRFDDAPIPTPSISARPKSERLSPDPVTAERPQESPLAHEQE